MDNWCVLFVKTGMEEKILGQLKNLFNVSITVPFLITKEQYFRKAGTASLIKNICFPGYLFIKTALSAEDLLRAVSEPVRKTKDVYRLLSYSGNNDIFIRRHEVDAFKTLSNTSHCIESSAGVIVGDAVRIKSGPLVGMESSIKKIDRRRRSAVIHLNFMGGIRKVTLALNILEKA